ncbi:MAG: ABC transporter permease [Anaerolineae bacterium]|nr:ABC transporter permease [Anaerolineae bacterium]
MSEARVLSLQAEEQAQHSRSFWLDAVHYLRRDRLSIIALVILLVLTLLAFLGPPIVENALGVEVNRTDISNRYQPPGMGSLLGTDHLGRDQFIRLLYGGRISLSIAYTASIVSITIGVLVGIAAGYYGGVVDDIIIWFINTIESVPTIFLLLIAATVWSPSPEVLIMILGALGWFTTCRIVRGQVLSIKERDYMLAARSIGSSARWIMLNHILPNTLSVVIISLTINAGTLILIESGLSYLGLGVQPPTPTWGNMLTDSRSYFVQGTHLVVWPGALITLTVLCFYLVGDGLRDALDPRRVRGR